MNKRTRDLAEMLIENSKNFVNYDYKKHALEEIENLEKKNIFAPNIAFIVEQYPDFNHIAVKLEISNSCIFKICIKPNIILENKNVAYKLAKMMNSWFVKGARFEDEKRENNTYGKR